MIVLLRFTRPDGEAQYVNPLQVVGVRSCALATLPRKPEGTVVETTKGTYEVTESITDVLRELQK